MERLLISHKRQKSEIFSSEHPNSNSEYIYFSFDDCQIELHQNGTWKFYESVGLQILEENINKVVQDRIEYLKKNGTKRLIKTIEEDLKYYIKIEKDYSCLAKQTRPYIELLRTEILFAK